MDDRTDERVNERVNEGSAPPGRAERPRALAAPAPRPRAARLDAGALVAALWRAHPPDVWASGRPWHLGDGRGLQVLTQLAERAERLAARGGDTRAAARLLAETARAIAAVLARDPAADGPAARANTPADAAPTGTASGGALASPARRRLVRMERWLAARAAGDPAAVSAADLCLWAVEHLEAGGG
jgi:hypothetical protein